MEESRLTRPPTSSSGSEYLDIVNEINDFIASLDAPPLDNHTNKLVGNQSSSASNRKKTFGNHGDDDDPPESWEGLRSRNRSGEDPAATATAVAKNIPDGKLVEDSTTAPDENVDVSSLEFEQALEDDGDGYNLAPFPVALPQQDSDRDPFATYDYVGLGCIPESTLDYTSEVSSDYSNTSSGGSYSVYSDGGSSNSSCEAADSDSGCYSQFNNSRDGLTSGSGGVSGTTVLRGHDVRSSGQFPPSSSGTSIPQQSFGTPSHPDPGSNNSNGTSPPHGQDSVDQPDLGLGSSARSLSSSSSSSSSFSSSSPPTSYSTSPPSSSSKSISTSGTAPTRFQRDLPNPHHPHPHSVPIQPQRQQQQHHHQQSSSPKDRFLLHQENRSSPKQGGQFSAPTSPAIKRKVFNNRVIGGLKAGRSFDDSHSYHQSGSRGLLTNPSLIPSSSSSPLSSNNQVPSCHPSLPLLSSPFSSTTTTTTTTSLSDNPIGEGVFKTVPSDRPPPPPYSSIQQRTPTTNNNNHPPPYSSVQKQGNVTTTKVQTQQPHLQNRPIKPTKPNWPQSSQQETQQSFNQTPSSSTISTTTTTTTSTASSTSKLSPGLSGTATQHHQQPPPLSSSNEVKTQQGPNNTSLTSSVRHPQHPHQNQLSSSLLGNHKQYHQQASASITKVPDLSVLISELRSVSPSSDPSPPSSSTYTAFARSENVTSSSSSPSSLSSSSYPSPALSRTSETGHHHYHHPSITSTGSGHNKVTGFEHKALGLSHYHTPTSSSQSSHFGSQSSGEDRGLGAGSSCSGSSNEGARCSFSPEHDYEPIENIQLEIPTSPRPDPKFPHPRGQGQRKMADGGAQPKHVKALHNFKGSNNDELCFKKGDIITVTQCLEGGWWEGTLSGRTGWFPSNYAKEVRADISLKSNKSGDVPVYKRESMQLYHNVVLKNVIETEKTHVSEMIKVLQSYIKPIEGANLLNGPEYKLLVGNLEEVIAFQQSFLAALEECEKLPSSQRRIGGVFMQFAPDMKDMYSLYCANHPRSVSILQTRREELSKFVENQGAPVPGAQTLTTILSKPFTRLDKYPSLLKELERHVEESHPDRGDTQRAIAVYKNITNTCSEIRKMKEMEHEIITSTIQGWEGEEISKLGEVLHLSQIKLLTQTGEKFERIFLLFQSCLVMLSMSSRLSSYQYEGNIPLSGLTTINLDGECFEITGPMIEKINVSCSSKTDASTWVDLLNQLVSTYGHPASSAKPQPLQVHMISTCQPSLSTVTSAKTAQISSTTAPVQGPIPPSSIPGSNQAPVPPSSQNPLLAAKTSCVWSLTCLRPSPPLRPSLMCRDEVLKSPRAVRKSTQKRKPDDPKVYNEDAFILQVIEAYCNSVKTRHTVNSCRIEVPLDKKKAAVEVVGKGKAILNSPQILLAEEEKIFDESEQQERTVVDTVYALQDRVKELEQEHRKMRIDLDEERRCRQKLEKLVRGQIIKSGIIDVGSGVIGDSNAT